MITNCSAEIKRLVYEDNVARGKQTVLSIKGYLTAVNENFNLMSDGKFGKLYKISLMGNADIKESDEVVVDNVSYTVKGVAYRHGGNLSLTTVILEKGV